MCSMSYLVRCSRHAQRMSWRMARRRDFSAAFICLRVKVIYQHRRLRPVWLCTRTCLIVAPVSFFAE